MICVCVCVGVYIYIHIYDQDRENLPGSSQANELSLRLTVLFSSSVGLKMPLISAAPSVLQI